MKFSEKLKKLRHRDNLTQKELADATAINHSALRKYEIDINKPLDKHVHSLANIFKINPTLLKDFNCEHFQLNNNNDVLFLCIELIKYNFLDYKLDKDNNSFNLKASNKAALVFDENKIQFIFKNESDKSKILQWLIIYDEYIKAFKAKDEIQLNELKNKLEELEFKLCIE